jgi:outer membrane protein assembly factor BamB
MRRWLVSLALAVVVLPSIGDAADALRVAHEHHSVTTTGAPLSLTGEAAAVLERTAVNELYIKERGELLALDRATQTVRWARPTTTAARIAVIGDAVVDAWVDRVAHRYGVMTYDRASGRRLGSVELGRTGGWYDLERIVVAPDAPGEILVSALFGRE